MMNSPFFVSHLNKGAVMYYCYALWRLPLNTRLARDLLQATTSVLPHLFSNRSYGTRPIPTNGQVLHTSHPHYLRPNEIWPGMQPDLFKARRARLVQVLPPSSVVLLPGYGLRYASGPVFYPFQQNTNLLYYTGCNEPDAFLVLHGSATKEPHGVLFCHEQGDGNVVFDGTYTGVEESKQIYQLEEVRPLSELRAYLAGLKGTTIYADISDNSRPSDLESMVGKTKSILPFTDALRSIKSKEEIGLLELASKAAAHAHRETMRITRAGLNESNLAASLAYHVSWTPGTTGLSYVPVVAGGQNALVLHYVQNQHQLG